VSTSRPAAATPQPAPATIGAALTAYLARRGGQRVVACERVAGGYETFIYRLQLGGAGTLPAERPLILRVYQGPGVAERSAWEAAVTTRVRAAGVPVPAVHLYEPDFAPLGGPFLLLDLARGARMDEAAGDASPLTVVRMIRNFARMQTGIHQIEWPDGVRLAPGLRAGDDLGPFVWAPERLAQARRALAERRLEALLPLLDWLVTRQARLQEPSAPRVLIHGDYHPLNVFMDGPRVADIIDWGAGGFAGAHEDIGWTSLLLATVTAADARQDRGFAPVRTLGQRAYIAAIWEATQLGRAWLRYGEVYAGLRWLLLFLPSVLPDAGPPLLNADARDFATPRYVRRVLAFINRRTSLKLELSSRGLQASPNPRPLP
jgi:aminoglycoside phosphotransferase (APT) family kinase protein